MGVPRRARGACSYGLECLNSSVVSGQSPQTLGEALAALAEMEAAALSSLRAASHCWAGMIAHQTAQQFRIPQSHFPLSDMGRTLLLTALRSGGTFYTDVLAQACQQVAHACSLLEMAGIAGGSDAISKSSLFPCRRGDAHVHASPTGTVGVDKLGEMHKGALARVHTHQA